MCPESPHTHNARAGCRRQSGGGVAHVIRNVARFQIELVIWSVARFWLGQTRTFLAVGQRLAHFGAMHVEPRGWG